MKDKKKKLSLFSLCTFMPVHLHALPIYVLHNLYEHENHKYNQTYIPLLSGAFKFSYYIVLVESMHETLLTITHIWYELSIWLCVYYVEIIIK